MLRNKVRKISNKLGTHFKLEHDGVKCQTLHWLALELGTDDGGMQEHTVTTTLLTDPTILSGPQS